MATSFLTTRFETGDIVKRIQETGLTEKAKYFKNNTDSNSTSSISGKLVRGDDGEVRMEVSMLLGSQGPRLTGLVDLDGLNNKGGAEMVSLKLDKNLNDNHPGDELIANATQDNQQLMGQENAGYLKKMIAAFKKHFMKEHVEPQAPTPESSSSPGAAPPNHSEAEPEAPAGTESPEASQTGPSASASATKTPPETDADNASDTSVPDAESQRSQGRGADPIQGAISRAVQTPELQIPPNPFPSPSKSWI
jgi:hypothetical protein